ncbi:TonB-dependent receptor domain-containing protein [Acidiluteibacter ferrifornacis]|uniref:TonB-dependent receptor n=1 Tax=Acidiluteibacter ferrifornacis TaxID=2692424 RepID=A0A6N9NG14_9FLAO|nr:TonB-dependent receptor [Acidiluteibacter ferrifornacis]NBG64742.1 TonB-dependent receptor [Acidiluteibacter ferrifornacis]
MKNVLLILLVFNSLVVFSQKGTIRGTVIEDATGETVIGASVVIKNTINGVSTDLDGQFSLQVEEGTYDLVVSYISFESLTIQSVIVKSGEVTLLNNIRMRENSLQLGEVMITATATRKSEAAINTMKKKSVSMMDGISAEKMKMTGDATAVEAAKRVTGVSIEGGKYVYVRGLGDRYTKVTLNEVDIPGLDPDKNSLQMDIFPSNLIDNIVVSKNFTADMPADFTGGIMNIETKAFPEEELFTVSAGFSYNPQMHFNSDFISSEGSSTDFLGFDDGTRALPENAKAAVIPTPYNGATPEQVNSFVNEFNPELGATKQTSLMDFSGSLSYGNQIKLNSDNSKNPKLGYIFSLSYKTDYKYYDDVTYGEYQRKSDPNDNELVSANLQEGVLAEKNVLVGALAGVAYKTNLSKVRLTVMHLQNGESKAGQFKIDNNPEGVGQSGYFAESNNLEYNQRTLSNLLLNGTHRINTSGWEIDWRVSPTYSTSNDPDVRSTAFTQTATDTFFAAGGGGLPSRIWRSLQEVNVTSKIDLTKDYKLWDEDAKLKFGVSHNYKNRNYEILRYDVQFFYPQQWNDYDPNNILTAENLYPNRPNGIFYQSGNADPNPNAYESSVNNTAVYISNEFSITPNLKSIVGIRAENYVQKHTGRDIAYATGDEVNGKNLEDEKVLESLDFFPSINLIYAIAEEQNLRFAFSQTIARPSFKELSFAQILDPISNRSFNGSLFTYSDWDGELVVTNVNNIDFRWEKFMERGQILSASLFYKTFKNPIELVRIPEQQTSTEFQPRNVGDGQLLGLELEATKSLAFISEKIQNFSVSGNLTLVQSRIDMTDREYNARKEYERTGESIKNYRPMAGQAPYVVNFGLSYGDVEKGIQTGLFYNVKGAALQIVGSGLTPDVFQDPFHSLNFGFNKKLGEDRKTAIDIKIANILNDKVESVFKSYEAADQIFSSLNPGITFGIGITHKF